MAEKTSIVGTDDKGRFTVAVPRSSIERIDIIDIDLVLQTKSGDRLILPGAAIEAMTARPPAVAFPDGAVGAGELLQAVDKVVTPPSSIPAMTSLTQFDQKRTEGRKNLTHDATADHAAQADQAQSQQVAPLPVQGNQSAVDKLVEKAEAMEADIRKKAFDPATPKVWEPPPSGPDAPPNPPSSIKIPMYVSLAEGNVVNTTDNHVGNVYYGSGGPSGSALANGILASDALQYGTETLTGTAAAETFYADGFYRAAGTWTTTGGSLLNGAATYTDPGTGALRVDTETGLPTTGGALYYAKEIQLNVAGYVRSASSITISGLPDGVFIEGGTKVGTSWTIPVGSVFPTAQTLTLVYDVTKVQNLGNVIMSVNIVGISTEAFDITRKFMLHFAAIGDSAGVNQPPVFITGPGGGWSDIYVMPTASAPHVINAGDGANVVYAANSADTITAGTGDDVIYAFAGNDTIDAGEGKNTIWAGNGNDKVTTGGGDDTIHLGNGANTVDDSGGTNLIDSSADSGDDVVTVSAAGTNTITLGVANDGIADGNDTVTTGTGIDTIKVGDGNNVVVTGNGDKSVVAGGGNDTVVTGSGNDVITVGDADAAAGSTNRNIVWAGDGKNTITAGTGNDTLVGGAGIDSIVAGDGNDWVYGGAGNNNAANGGTLDGGAGVDWLSFNGIANTVDATYARGKLAEGAATLADWLAHAGTDVAGVSFVANASGSGTATKGGGTTDDVAGFENLIGSQGDDTLDMSAYTGISHTLYGLDGNDVLAGSDKDDVLYGGAGNDSIRGGAGNDIIFTALSSVDATETAVAGTAVDSAVGIVAGTLSATAAAGGGGATFTGLSNVVDAGDGADTVIGGAGDDYFITVMGQSADASGTRIDTFAGGAGTDTLDLSSYTVGLDVTLSPTQGSVTQAGSTTTFANFSGIERIVTGSAADTITGSSGADIIYTGKGNDIIYTKAGNDTVYAGDGNDVLYAEGGNDFLYGENNDDTFYGYGGSGVLATSATVNMIGGAGSNTFVLYGSTEIIDATGGSNDSISYWNGYSTYGVTSGSMSVTISGKATTVTFGIFANLSTTDYGVAQGGALVADATQSYWRTGSTVAASTWTAMGAGTNGYQWMADNDQHGYYANAQNDRYYGVENITGTNYNDVLIGNNSNNVISGNGGHDALYGLGGDDYFTYGGGNTYVDGGGTYAGGGGGGSALTMTATGVTGGDTLDMNTQTVALTVTLVADGATNPDSSPATGTVTNGTNTVTFMGIENFIAGSGDDVIYGTADSNYIVGGLGSDTIYGYGGDDIINLGQNRQGLTDVGISDTADGGSGTDWISYNGVSSYNGALGVEIHLEQARAGASASWTQYAKITIGANSYRYGDLTGFENAQGSGYADIIVGTTGDNVLWGMGGVDTITAGAGNDTLDGGTGNDTMIGGIGNDVYYVDSGSDVVSEVAGEGTDIVYTTANYTLAANVENLTATGTGNYSLTGNALDNTITGSSGNDALNGGTGADALIGGAGNDTYTVDNAGDTITEAAGEGIDTVSTSIAWTLGSNLENLTASGGASIALTGNSLDNIITGNGGNNVISAGAGADTLNGSGGTDSLSGDADSDTFVLTVGQLASTSIYGGSGNAYTNLATENGSDTLKVADWNLSTNFSVARLHSVEAIDIRGGSATAVTTSELSYATIDGILDGAASGGTLKLYLDSGDIFTTTGSTTGAGTAPDPGGAHTATYTYTSSGNSHQVEVHWG